MSRNGPFGIDPEEFDRVVREAGEGLRDALDGVGRFLNTSGERAGWANLVDEFTRYSRPKREPETTGETGDGVWAIYTVDSDGGAHIEQVYPSDWMRYARTRTTPTPPARCAFCPTASRSVCSTHPNLGTRMLASRARRRTPNHRSAGGCPPASWYAP
jgi:hypothetical protein